MASGPSLRHDALRAAVAEIVQPLQHPRAGEVVVDLVLEDDRDQREAEHRVRAHRLHARESLEIHRERIGDLILDLLRTAPGPVGEDDHLVLAQVRDGIDRRVAKARIPHAMRSSVPHATRKRLRSDHSISQEMRLPGAALSVLSLPGSPDISAVPSMRELKALPPPRSLAFPRQNTGCGFRSRTEPTSPSRARPGSYRPSSGIQRRSLQDFVRPVLRPAPAPRPWCSMAGMIDAEP